MRDILMDTAAMQRVLYVSFLLLSVGELFCFSCLDCKRTFSLQVSHVIWE